MGDDLTMAEKAILPKVRFADNPLDHLPRRWPAETLGKRKIEKYRREEALIKPSTRPRTDRMHRFVGFLLDLAEDHNGIAPYAFRLANGAPSSLDWGCIGLLVNRGEPEAILHKDADGFVTGVEPTAALWARAGRSKSIAPATRLLNDLAEIKRAPMSETTRERLVKARLGQGGFREDLIRSWGGGCAVTGIAISAMLRASHIRAWSDSDNDQRLDPENGLLLAAHLDCLFDCGLIGFGDDGQMIVSKAMGGALPDDYGVGKPLRRRPTNRMKAYLAFHRQTFQLG